MAADYSSIIDSAAHAWNVDPALLRAVIQQESSSNPKAVSKAGARGLTGIMPDTATGLGITDLSDTEQQIYGGAKYLSEGLDKEGTPEKALLYYHGGPAWRDNYGPESAGYVPAVTAKYKAITTQATPAIPAPPEADDPFTAALKPSTQSQSPTQEGDPFSQAVTEAQKAVPAKTATPTPVQTLDPITGFPVDSQDPSKPVPGAPTVSAGQAQGTLAPSSAPAASDIVHAGMQGMKEGFGSDPLGLSPQTQTALENNGVYNKPGEYNPLKAINRAVINPLAAGADLALRGESALLRGGQAVVAQTGAALGAPILGRDLAALPEAFMGSAPDAGIPRAPEVRAAPPEGLPGRLYSQTPQQVLESGAPNTLRAPSNDTYPNPLARSPEGARTPAFVPPGSTIPPEIVQATRPAFVPPEPPVSPTGRVASNDTANPLSGATTQSANPLQPGEPTSPTRTVPHAPEQPAAPAEPNIRKPEVVQAKADQAAQADTERKRLLSAATPGGDVTEYVPGVRLTRADITGDAKDATEQKRLSQSPEAAQQFKDLQAHNNDARAGYYDQIAGQPSDIAALKAARAGQAEEDLSTAFANKGSADAAPVVSTINQILKGPDGVRPLVKQKLNQVLDTLHDANGNLQTDPEMLYGARKSIDDTLSKEAAKSEPLNARVATHLQEVKSALDKAIEPAAPGFDAYLKNFSKASKPIDAMELLQEFQPKLTNTSDRTMTFGKFDSMMKNIVQQRSARGSNAAKSIPTETMDKLFNLHADLRRGAHTDELAKVKGSDTSQLLDYGKKLGLTTAHGLAAHALPVVGNALVHYGSESLSRRAAEKQIKKHLFPNVEKLTKGKNSLQGSDNPLSP